MPGVIERLSPVAGGNICVTTEADPFLLAPRTAAETRLADQLASKEVVQGARMVIGGGLHVTGPLWYHHLVNCSSYPYNARLNTPGGGISAVVQSLVVFLPVLIRVHMLQHYVAFVVTFMVCMGPRRRTGSFPGGGSCRSAQQAGRGVCVWAAADARGSKRRWPMLLHATASQCQGRDALH